ncbi:hypothetical protein PIB30_044511 [Stylosanthes scabra]|uniref:Large ribosomal subunit protein uL2 RNA-binding domain-containing protein n=1 Tax=Stylosanthes scabra TaxID=79078 RepID=A0ABU6QF82_9FABA|nr:hypothetical protein [Stylosanthes scabra]
MEKILQESQVPEVHDKYHQSPILQRKLSEVLRTQSMEISRLIPDKANLGFRFPCDGPGRRGTCQVSAWDHVFLGLFWMYNAISVVIFHFSWKMQSDGKGRNARGIITTGHRGGGHKRLYRKIDFCRNEKDIYGRIVTIEYDPNRNAYISLDENTWTYRIIFVSFSEQIFTKTIIPHSARLF